MGLQTYSKEYMYISKRFINEFNHTFFYCNPPVQTPVLNSFRQMFGFYIGTTGKVCNGTANLQYPVIARPKVKFFHGDFQQVLAGCIDHTDLFQHFAAHLCIGINTFIIFISFFLYFPGFNNPFAYTITFFKLPGR